MSLDPDSLERLVPDALDPGDAAARATLALHFERYEFAARVARAGRLLDLACGVGYGTELLLARNPSLGPAVGVDVSTEAIAHANARYGGGAARFIAADALSFRDPEGFDTIVSLETLEHVDEPERLFSHLASLLRPGGVLVASVPTTPSVDLNPHHRHDFSERSFRALGARQRLRERDALRQVQRVALASGWRGRRFRRAQLRANLPSWYLAHPDSLLRRIGSTLRHGFANHYLTVAWEREPDR
ncbi:MAG TPA: class I SAM-dependent methyltransferase [Myxococcota bacterium]|nr:class I SAM-dependent methyltransferase [Myxococcota bacterium]